MTEHICTPIDKQFGGVYFVGHVGFDPHHPDVAKVLRGMGWVKLPERLSRDQAEPLCEYYCTNDCSDCFGDCECNAAVQKAWAVLRGRLINED